MDYEFEVSEQPLRHTLYIRTFTSAQKLPEELGRAYHTIIEYLSTIGESPSDAAFACYHNMAMQNLDVEMGFIAAKPLPEKGDIKPGKIPAGKQLSYVHKGSYKELESVYKAMMQWIQQSEHTPTGLAYELYYNSPNEVPESELLTRVSFH